MPYQGNTPAENYVVTVKDSFSGNGAATAFTLSQPTVTNDVRVVVENVVQDPTVAYAVSGTTLTFTSAPVSGTNNIYVIHLGPAVQQVAPPSTISNATTFESNVSVQGLFNSVGIDDNADATAITIDSSEVVLVGKTSNTFSQQGVALRANNDSQITRDGGHPLSLNRTSSDGDILKVYKAGTEVGSIGSNSGYIYVGSGDVNLRFHAGADAILPATTGGTTRSDAVDLGTNGAKFKDLYLSGNVIPASGKGIDFSATGGPTAGSGTSELFDDYEEGTWTPTIFGTDTAGTYSLESARTGGTYTKIGRTVYVNAVLRIASITSAGAGVLNFGGFPYVIGANIAPSWSPGFGVQLTHYGAGSNSSVGSYPPPFVGVGSAGASSMGFNSYGKNYKVNSNIADLSSNSWIYQISGFYDTAS